MHVVLLIFCGQGDAAWNRSSRPLWRHRESKRGGGRKAAPWRPGGCVRVHHPRKCFRCAAHCARLPNGVFVRCSSINRRSDPNGCSTPPQTDLGSHLREAHRIVNRPTSAWWVLREARMLLERRHFSARPHSFFCAARRADSLSSWHSARAVAQHSSPVRSSPSLVPQYFVALRIHFHRSSFPCQMQTHSDRQKGSALLLF
jgi:hypothetical protein